MPEPLPPWLARLASGAGSRTIKYRHLAHEALKVDDAELALIAVLLLRGPQTVGELRTRTERLHPFASLGTVTAVLDQLARRELVELLEREPGRKEPRYAHRLGPRGTGATGGSSAPDAAPARSADAAQTDAASSAEPVGGPPAAPTVAHADAPTGPSTAELVARIAALEARVEQLEALLD